MKGFGQFFFGFVLFVLSVGALGLFEYFKLSEASSRYLILGIVAPCLLFASTFTFLPKKHYGRAACLKYAFVIAILAMLAEVGFLGFLSRSPLNQTLHANGRCESTIVELFKKYSNGELQNIQNLCSLRLLKDSLEGSSVEHGGPMIVEVGQLLADKDQLNDTTLVLLLSFYANLESAQNEKEGNGDSVSQVNSQLNLLEGALPLFEAYRLKSAFDEHGRSSEPERMQKLLELSTLGKILNVFWGKERMSAAVVGGLSGQMEKATSVPSAELLLLQARIQKIAARLSAVEKKWDLLSVLESLNLKENFPDQYQRVLEEVSPQPEVKF